jgi:hypothetical protein
MIHEKVIGRLNFPASGKQNSRAVRTSEGGAAGALDVAVRTHLSGLTGNILRESRVMCDVFQITRNTLIDFCFEFLDWPYLCYTEHGLHGLFLTKLYNALPPKNRYSELNGQRFCVVQKEYPTNSKLEKSKRQHWDISVIKQPVMASTRTPAFDYLPLTVVIEFGLNCNDTHLREDIRRLSHRDSNVDNGFIVHLYRLSNPKDKFSGRDWSAKSARLFDKQKVQTLLQGYKAPRKLEVLYAIADTTKPDASGLWSITSEGARSTYRPRSVVNFTDTG